MRNTMKKAICALLALSLCLGLTACYSEENTWAAKCGDDVMPIGSYIYYLNGAFSDAGAQVPATEEVLKAQIDGQSVPEWAKARAMSYIGAYYYLQSRMDELGLSITDEDTDSINSASDSYWGYFKDTFEGMGIAESSFKKAYAEYNMLLRKVMLATYGEGGEQALSEDELQAYYEDNYDSYAYMYVSSSKNDESGNNVALTDEEKADLQKAFDDYAKGINSGDTTLSDAYMEYQSIALVTPSYETPGSVAKTSVPSAIAEVLPDMDDNEAQVVEVDAGYYLLQKLPLKEQFDTVMGDETQKENLVAAMKGEEFTDFVLEQGAAFEGVTYNDKAINLVKLEKIVTDKAQRGTSSAPSDEASSAASSDDTGSAASSSAAE